jgi:hypothetical protein
MSRSNATNSEMRQDYLQQETESLTMVTPTLKPRSLSMGQWVTKSLLKDRMNCHRAPKVQVPILELSEANPPETFVSCEVACELNP